MGGGGTKGGGGENGGDPRQGCPVTGPHRSKLLAKLHKKIYKKPHAYKFYNIIMPMDNIKKIYVLATNLMGVKRENEPLSGTGPERRLFDRSLKELQIV